MTKKYLVLIIFTILITLLSPESFALAQNLQQGGTSTINGYNNGEIGSNEILLDKTGSADQGVIPTSDEYALQRLKEMFGDEVASHAKSRIKESYKSKYPRYFDATIITGNSAVYAGYDLSIYGDGNLYSARGQWNAASITGNDAVDAPWVGIGDGQGLLQTGLDMQTMWTWWMYATNPRSMSASFKFQVSAGD